MLPVANFTIEPNEQVEFKILYEDPDMLVVDKPARIVTTPGAGHDRNSLLNGLFAKYGKFLQNLGQSRDFGLLHRLDRETSGLLLVALRASAYDSLREQFESRRIRKFYLAVASHAPRQASGVIRRPIAEVRQTRGGRELKLARISAKGKPAITAYRVLDQVPAASYLECRAVTGRLHQVRVHLESIGCPIFGDDFYAPPAIAEASGRLALHAHRVALSHPISGQPVDVRSPLPRDMRRLLTKLGLRPEPPVAKSEPEESSPDADEAA